MRHITTSIAVCAALALIGASCVMNYFYWSAQGRGVVEGHIFGTVSVAFDVFKALLPLLIAFAIASRRWVYATVGSLAFVLFLAAGLLGAIGFTSLNKGAVVDGRDRLSSRHALAKTELNELDSRASRITGIPSISTIEANLSALRQDRRWSATKGCVDATLNKSKQFCKSYFDQRARLSDAVEVSRLDNRRRELRGEVNRLRDAGAGEAADPQATMLAGLVPKLDVSGAQLAVVIFFGILVELGASFGLFLATRHSVLPQLIRRTEPNEGIPVILEPAPIAISPPRRRVLGPMVDRKYSEPRRFVLDESGRAFMAGE